MAFGCSRRPTAAEPIAWVPAERRRELTALLTWLEVTQVREHHGQGLGELAVIDLPDFDSIAPEHRRRVDELLPRVDAVAWVVDPEKYKDEIVHGGYLQSQLGVYSSERAGDHPVFSASP